MTTCPESPQTCDTVLLNPVEPIAQTPVTSTTVGVVNEYATSPLPVTGTDLSTTVALLGLLALVIGLFLLAVRDLAE